MSQQRTSAPTEDKAILAEIEKELHAETSKEAAPLLDFVLENIQKIIIALVAIVFSIGVFGFWQWQSESNFAKADIEFQKITAIQSPSQRVELLDNFAKDAPKGLQIAISLEQARAYVEDNNQELAAQKLSALLKQEKNSPLATTIAFSLSDLYQSMDKPSMALEMLEEYLKVAPKSIQPSVLEEVANVAYLANNKERALLAYTSLLSMPEAAQSHGYYQEKVLELSN